jgi:hypothetical protein
MPEALTQRLVSGEFPEAESPHDTDRTVIGLAAECAASKLRGHHR